jgi:hypothetical protein
VQKTFTPEGNNQRKEEEKKSEYRDAEEKWEFLPVHGINPGL